MQFGECCFGVFEDGDVGGSEAGDGVFGCVGAGLDLIWESIRCVREICLKGIGGDCLPSHVGD